MPNAPPPVSAGPAAQAAYQRDQAAAVQAQKNALIGGMLGGTSPTAMPTNALASGAAAPVGNMLAPPRPMNAAPVPPSGPATPPPPPNMPPPGAMPPRPMPPALPQGPPPAQVAPDPNAALAQAMQHATGAGMSPAAVDQRLNSNIGAMQHIGRLLGKAGGVSKMDAVQAAIEAAQAGVISSNEAAGFVQHIGSAAPGKVAEKLQGLMGDLALSATALSALKQQTPPPGPSAPTPAVASQPAAGIS